MRHFSFPLPVAGHPLCVPLASLPAVLVAPASLLQSDVARDVGTCTAAVDLAVVAVGANEHLDTARQARAKIESTNWCGIHRLAPCQADQEWTGRPTRAMGYSMHIPCSGFAGGSAGKNLSGFGLAPPPSFLRGKGRFTAAALQGACSRTNQRAIIAQLNQTLCGNPLFCRQWRAPCFRRDTELPDQEPSVKGYRPGSYRRTSPKCRRRPLHGARIALRLAGVRFSSMGAGRIQVETGGGASTSPHLRRG